MNTLSEKLGVAVEADAARYSGGDFAESRGAAITARVRRKRQVRAVGVGGATTLAMGAVVVAGARLPWGGLGSTLALGGADCATQAVTLSAAATSVSPTQTGGSGVTYATSGSSVIFTDSATGEEFAMRFDGDAPTVSDGQGGISTLRQHDDGSYSFEFTDGGLVSFTIERDDAGAIAVVAYSAPAAGSAVATSIPVTPTPSEDCLTPEPSATSDHAPTPDVGGISTGPVAAESPFQCGFAFPAPVGSTAVITVGTPTWQTPGAAEAAAQSMSGHDEPGTFALSGNSVPVVQYSSVSSWPGGNYGGLVSPIDPAEHIGGYSWGADGETIEGGFVDGAQFVLQADDVVIATYTFDGEYEAGRTQFLNGMGEGDGTLFGLDLTEGFTACPGVDPNTLDGALAVAVAGTMLVDGDGPIDGPYYAWQYITQG